MDNTAHRSITLEGPLPQPGEFDPAVRRAPKREACLSLSLIHI